MSRSLIAAGSRTAATSKMEHFVIIVNYRWKPLTIITKRSILDVAAVLDTPLLINFKLITNLYFKWIQLVHAIPYHRKKTLTENTINSQSYLNHHLMKSHQIHSVENLTAEELYLISLQHETATATSQKYLERMF